MCEKIARDEGIEDKGKVLSQLFLRLKYRNVYVNPSYQVPIFRDQATPFLDLHYIDAQTQDKQRAINLCTERFSAPRNTLSMEKQIITKEPSFWQLANIFLPYSQSKKVYYNY